MRSLIRIAFLCIAAAASLPAQTVRDAIVGAEGASVTVVRDNREMALEDARGFQLAPGDLLQTGRKTSVEFTTASRISVVKVAENTTLKIRSLEGPEGVRIELIYGRLRARVQASPGGPAYAISSGGTVAQSSGADFGLDSVISKASRQGQARTSVYCFEGEVKVDAAADPRFPVEATENLLAGRMAESRLEEGRVLLFQTDMQADIGDFWKANAYRSPDAALVAVAAPAPLPEPPAATEAKAEPVPVPEPVPPEAAPPIQPEIAVEANPRESPEWPRIQAAVKAKNVLLGAGSILCLSGLAMQAIGFDMSLAPQGRTRAAPYISTGISVSGVGLLITLIGLLANPAPPGK